MDKLLLKLQNSKKFNVFQKEILKSICEQTDALFILRELLKDECDFDDIKNDIKKLTMQINLMKRRNKRTEIRLKMFKKQIPLMDSYAYRTFCFDDLKIAIEQSNSWKGQYNLEKKILNQVNEKIKELKLERKELINQLKEIDN